MPEFTVKEVRLPELHLPEIKRDEIVRVLSGIRLPAVDQTLAEPRRRMPGIDLRSLPWRRQIASGLDAGKLIAAAVTAARIARPAPRRSRWMPFRQSRWAAIGRSRDNLVAVVRPAPRRSRRRLVVVAIALAAAAGWMLLRTPAVRVRLDGAATEARRRMDGMHRGAAADVDLDAGEPVSVTATENALDALADDTSAAAETEVTEGAGNPA